MSRHVLRLVESVRLARPEPVDDAESPCLCLRAPSRPPPREAATVNEVEEFVRVAQKVFRTRDDVVGEMVTLDPG